MLRRRGDPRVTDVTDLSIDFDDLDHDGITDQHLSFSFIADNATGTVTQKTRPGVTPSVGRPATPSGTILDTQGEADHLFRMEAIREIVERVLADNHLDALIYPFETIPPPILSGTKDSIAWLVYDGRQNRGWNSFGDASGLPDIGVPAGFTQVVYDRTTRGASSEQLALDPPSVRREVKLPLNIEFLGKPWSEPQLLELASAFEKARGPRTPRPASGPSLAPEQSSSSPAQCALMNETTSASLAIRRPGRSKVSPIALYSISLQPAPMPISSRPSESRSRVAASLANTAGT